MRAVHARLAEPDDLDAVVPVVRAIRADSPLGPQLVNPESGDIGIHLQAWFAQEHTRLAIVEADGEVIGVAMAQVVDVNLFSDTIYMRMEALYVDPEHRRRGAGRAMMGQIGMAAATAGAEQIVTLPIGGSRTEQRFLSGLGFAVVGAHRMIPTAALLRRLEKGRERRGRGLDELIARRRRSRGLPPTPAAGLSLEAHRRA